jgi:hypothetical protein
MLGAKVTNPDDALIMLTETVEKLQHYMKPKWHMKLQARTKGQEFVSLPSLPTWLSPFSG